MELQINWQRGTITCRMPHCNNRRHVSVDNQQEAASQTATNLSLLKKIFLVYIYLTQMLSAYQWENKPWGISWSPAKDCTLCCGGGSEHRLRGCQKSQARVVGDQRVWDSSGSTLLKRSCRLHAKSGLESGKGLSRRGVKICLSLLYKL